MAAASQGGGSVLDGLKKTFTDIGQLMLLQDSAAHMQFLTQLQHAIQGYVQQQLQKATGMAQAQMAGAAGMPGAGGGQPGGMGAPPPPNTTGGAMGGGQPGFNTSSPDELRRVLSATGQVQ